MDSATETALLDQSRVTPQLVLIAILLARPALNTPANVLHVNLAVEISSTTNALPDGRGCFVRVQGG